MLVASMCALSLACMLGKKHEMPFPSLSLPLKPGAMPPPRRDKPPMKKAPSPPPPGAMQGRPAKPMVEGSKPPANPREAGGTAGGAGGSGVGRPPPPREPGKPLNPREGRRKERQQHPPRR